MPGGNKNPSLILMIDMHVDLYFMYFDCSYMLAFLAFKFVINSFISSMGWGTAPLTYSNTPAASQSWPTTCRLALGALGKGGRGGGEILEFIVEYKSEKDGQWLPYKQPANNLQKSWRIHLLSQISLWIFN